MAEEVGKREKHAFLSHAHVDKTQADMLYDFLTRVAGIPVWYDTDDLPPGAAFAGRLFEGIENSRAAIILLSHESVDRGWVEEEYQAAQNQRANHKDFRVIPLRLDDVKPPGFLSNLSNIEIGKGNLDSASAARILQALYLPPHSTPNPGHGKHTYFSRGWRPSDGASAEALSEALSGAGLRLVSDARDQGEWDEERVGGILDGCGAYAAMLPDRPAMPERTSHYVLDEWRLAAARGIPCLVIQQPGNQLSERTRELPGLQENAGDSQRLSDCAQDLAEQWHAPRRKPHIFYSTEFGDGELHKRVTRTVEAVTGVPCLMGQDVPGPVQREIVRMVSSAAMVVADITRDSPNVYIEIGAALAAGVPVALLREGPPGRPAFMLRDQQVYDYATEAELVARAVKVTYRCRRFLKPQQSGA